MSNRRGPGQGRGGRAAAGRKGGAPKNAASGSGKGASKRNGTGSRGGARGSSRGVGAVGGVGGGAGRTGRISRGQGTAGAGTGRRGPGKALGGEQVEGRQAVRELLIAQTRRTYEVWIASDLQEGDSVDDIVALATANRVPVSWVARKRLEAEARSEAPQGVLAKAAPLPEADFATFLRRRPGRAPFLVAVDGVTDPGNLGAIVRSCDGAGADAIVVPRHRAVHVTPTVAKAAAGAVEHVPMALVPGLPAALEQLRSVGIWVIGLDDAADRSLFELGDLATEGVCLVLGAEGAGLSRLTRERCDVIVSIPMLGRLSSLNVSAAATLATYEIARLRSPHRR